MVEETVKRTNTVQGSVASPVAYAIMYCDYKNQDDESTQYVLGSLLGQIYAQIGGVPRHVVNEYRKCSKPPFWSSPKTTTLIKWLETVSGQAKLFIFVDALDENRSGPELFRTLRELANKPGKPGIMVTSRPNLELDDGVDLGVSRVNLENHIAEVDDDIRQYILHRLATDPRMKRWSQEKYRTLITDGLLHKSNGM